jgi:hypothetical protein
MHIRQIFHRRFWGALGVAGTAWGLGVAGCGGSPTGLLPSLRVESDAAQGTVVSEPLGISCGSLCQAEFAAGTTVSLRALPAPGFEFDGWQGACSGQGNPCALPLTESTTVAARFAVSRPTHSLTVTKAGVGAGSVQADVGGLSCGPSCQLQARQGTVVTLRAQAAADSVFAGFGGDCSGREPTCTLSLDRDLSVIANFAKPQGCEEIQANDPAAQDGPFTLFAQGDPAKPWAAYCGFADPVATYLPLVNTDNANFSQYTAGGGRGGSNVRTAYQRLRIDPKKLRVHEGDKRFSISVGQLSDGTSAMNYGAASDCFATNSSRGVGNIDLTGTPFAVAPNAFVLGGYIPAGRVTYSANDQIVNLTGGGFCGGHSVRKSSDDPFNLQLVYIGK